MFLLHAEWYYHLYNPSQVEKLEIVDEHADVNIKRSALAVKCRASRRPAYFFWNIFLVTVSSRREKGAKALTLFIPNSIGIETNR